MTHAAQLKLGRWRYYTDNVDDLIVVTAPDGKITVIEKHVLSAIPKPILRLLQDTVDALCKQDTVEPQPNTKISSQGVAVDQNYFWDEDMSRCQRGVKYQLLGKGGMPEYKVYDGDPFWVAYALLPKRREPKKTCIRSVDANPPRSVPLRAAI